MQRLLTALLGISLGLGLAACQDPEADGCNPGTAGCQCIAGGCYGNLACIGNICAGASSTGPSTSDETAEGDGDEDPTTGGSGGMCDEPEVPSPYPAQACLPGVPCAADSNCPDGHVCNTELDPPACQLLYCGTEGSICHADEVCDEAFQCHEGQCNPCDICGDLCEVDFDTNPEHCGCCDTAVPIGGVCDNGTPTCGGNLSLCEGTCVDLDKDEDNCGECGNELNQGLLCEGGEATCPEAAFPLLLCDGECVDFLYDEQNCGACGATCPAGDCGYPGIMGITHTYCFVEIEPDPSATCTVACAELGMGCDTEYLGQVYYEGWCDGAQYVVECGDTVPDSVYCGDASCVCEIQSRACRCRPVPP